MSYEVPQSFADTGVYPYTFRGKLASQFHIKHNTYLYMDGLTVTACAPHLGLMLLTIGVVYTVVGGVHLVSLRSDIQGKLHTTYNSQ